MWPNKQRHDVENVASVSATLTMSASLRTELRLGEPASFRPVVK